MNAEAQHCLSGVGSPAEYLERLSTFGLKASEICWYDLELPPSETVCLSTRDPRFSRLVKRVPVKNADHLVRMMGMPPEAHCEGALRGAQLPRFFAAREGAPEVEALAAKTLAYKILGEKWHATPEVVRYSDELVRRNVPAISVAFLRDILVSRGATLVVEAKVLFSRYITVERGGVIEIPAGRHTAIDCTGIANVRRVLKSSANSEMLRAVGAQATGGN